MKKYFILFIITLFASLTSFAQLEVKQGSFKEVAGFVNINPDPNYQTDDNDLPYAVLKIRTENINDKQRHELNFGGNAGTFIMLEYKEGEVWVYLTAQYADYLKISHPDLSSIEFTFPFDLKPKYGYELTLANISLIDFNNYNNNYNDTINTIYSHTFSVGSTKKVYISRGNLQYQAYTRTWRFAEHQWDYIGNDNSNISSSYSGWIDLFGWGTSGYNAKDPYKINTSDNNYYGGSIDNTNYDWGVYNTIINGEGKKWRTPTKYEFEYILEIRETVSGMRYSKACVNGINGLIIFPDDWNIFNYKLDFTDRSDINYNTNNISLSDWIDIFEAHGAIFLPAAGVRTGASISNSNDFGEYWLSTCGYIYNDDRSAYRLYFGNNSVNIDKLKLHYGCSVRLVSDVE